MGQNKGSDLFLGFLQYHYPNKRPKDEGVTLFFKKINFYNN